MSGKKTRALKKLIVSRRLEVICEAHNALSARIVEDAGFKGIWASSLALSAANGVRDNNELNWGEVLLFAGMIADAVTVPVLLDGDTGYGDVNIFKRVVSKAVKTGIAGICIEDLHFPKENSFVRSRRCGLIPVEDFCDKIKAGQDVRGDDSFCIIARTEAFVNGMGLKEVLRRAEAYRKAGADAVFVHSKRKDAAEIDAFMKEWAGRHPVVVAPTMYDSVPWPYFQKRGVSVVILANYMLRAAVGAMQEVAVEIKRARGVTGVASRIAPLSEIFRLQGVDGFQKQGRSPQR